MPAAVMAPAQPEVPVGLCLRWPRSDAQMDLVAATGATSARIPINWHYVEATQGTYDWAATDAAFAACEARGMRPFALLIGCPIWAAGTTDDADIHGPSTPAQRAGFVAFAKAAATRYAGRVMLWEVWNEANGFFWLPAANAADYAALLKAVAPEIRAIDTAPIVSTGLAGNAGLGANEPLEWMRQMHDLDAITAADAFGFHPYSNGLRAVDGMLALVRSVRVTLDQWGYGWMPISCTEVGISTADVTAEVQADTFDLTVRYLRQLGIRWLCWYQDFDQTDWPTLSGTEQHFGAYALDGTPKPVVDRMRAQARVNCAAGPVPARQWVHDGAALHPARQIGA